MEGRAGLSEQGRVEQNRASLYYIYIYISAKRKMCNVAYLLSRAQPT